MYEKLLRRACGPEARMCLLVAAVVVSDLLFGLAPSWSCAHLIAAGFVGWMAALCAPLFVFGKYSRPFYCLLFSFYLPCRIVCGFVKKNFGMMPGPDTIAILKNSSWAEAKWFVGTYLDIWGLLVSIAVAGCLAAVLFATARLTGRIRGSWRKALLGCLLALVFAGYLSLFRDAKTGVAMSMPTLNLAISCFADGAKFDKLAGMKASPRFPDDIESVAGYEKCTGVFVLGESAARSHWSLYGYGRKTTPRMDGLESELAIFRDVVAPAPVTSRAMEYILTSATVETPDRFEYTMPQAMAKCGYCVSLYSMHERWANYGGIETYVFAGCEPMEFVKETEGEHILDDALLGRFDGFLQNAGGKSAVFLHMMGSHVPCGAQYPRAFARFGPAGGRQAGSSRKAILTHEYDNSILFTDYILGEIVDKLKKKGGPAWMVYVSDHGETPGTKWRSRESRDLWDVPMIVWLSDEYRRLHPDVVAALAVAAKLPLQSDQLLPGILRIAGIRFSGGMDFTSGKFVPRTPRKINCGEDEYRWSGRR